MYRYKNLHFSFSADTCTSTFATANIFPWYLLIRENFANEAVVYLPTCSSMLEYLEQVQGDISRQTKMLARIVALSIPG